MSEEILKALMQLFALIVKQDGGVEQSERNYVLGFLTSQLNDEDAREYIRLFDKYAGIVDGRIPSKGNIPTTVKDSVRILSICKKINRTLTQEQKVVVLVRLYELVNTDKKFTEQRMNIINTVAEVFRFTREEFMDIEHFVKEDQFEQVASENIMLISGKEPDCPRCRHIRVDSLPGSLAVLRISSVDLYFLKVFPGHEVSLNGLPVTPNRIYLLAPGSVIRMPLGKPVYYSDIVAHFYSDVSREKISFQVNNLSHVFQSGETALHQISFSEEEGKLIGIMGASGTGKTTLLNIMAGMETPSSGEVRINQTNLHREKDKVQGILGYIPQDDLLIEDLTVFENLYYSARLCFSNLSEKEITGRVIQTLQNLGLYEKKDLRVGSAMNKVISGGQRKRLNIALELIREPLILFVDEPTSGLSSRDSKNVMDLLRELAMKGKLIFVVIHQPSSELFKMFDNVLVLDQGGYMAYYGNPVEAVIYFKTQDAQINRDIGECPVCGNVNPELIFTIMESQVVDEFGRYTDKRRVTPEKWEKRFREHHSPQPVEEVLKIPASHTSLPGKLKQFFIYLIRDLKSKIANRQYVFLTLLEAPVLALILSYIIRYIADPNSQEYIFRENENIPIYIFMSLIVALFLGLTLSAEEIFRDRILLKRESFLNLSRLSYLMSKIVLLFSLSAFQALVFVLIGNSILGIRDMYFEYWMAFFTTAAFANMLGLNISASFNSAITIYIIIPLLIIPMMVLSGAMFSFDKLNRNISSVGKVPVIAELMATKWSYEALMVHQFAGNKYERLLYDVEKDESNTYFKSVEYIPFLQQILNKTITAMNQPESQEEYTRYLLLLKNEIESELENNPDIPFASPGQLHPDSFRIETAILTREYLNNLKEHYANLSQQASFRKEKLMEYYDRQDPDLFRELRKNYHNESVADIVRNIYERHPVLVYKNRVVRQYEPVFFDPEPSGNLDFRSHFYAPRKFFMGEYHNTFHFNMGIIWIMSLICFITLYFESLKKTIRFFELIGTKKFNPFVSLGKIKIFH